jgi:hypothetical protein
MSEMALTADHLIVIGRGRLLATGSVADFIERSTGHHVRAVTPDAEVLSALLRDRCATVTADGPDGLTVQGMECREVGILSAGAGLTLYELSTQRASLEDAFMELTHEHGDFRAMGDTLTTTEARGRKRQFLVGLRLDLDDLVRLDCFTIPQRIYATNLSTWPPPAVGDATGASTRTLSEPSPLAFS